MRLMKLTKINTDKHIWINPASIVTVEPRDPEDVENGGTHIKMQTTDTRVSESAEKVAELFAQST